jgi:hypothetical protein
MQKERLCRCKVCPNVACTDTHARVSFWRYAFVKMCSTKDIVKKSMIKLAEVKKANRDAHEAAERLIANAEDERQRTDAVSQQVFLLRPRLFHSRLLYDSAHTIVGISLEHPFIGLSSCSCRTCSTRRSISTRSCTCASTTKEQKLT